MFQVINIPHIISYKTSKTYQKWWALFCDSLWLSLYFWTNSTLGMGVTNSTNGGGRNIFKMGRTANLLQKNVNMLQIVVHRYIVSGAATLVLSETSRVNAEMRVSDIRRILGVATTQGLAGFGSNEFPSSFASQMLQKQFPDKRVNIFKLSSAATTLSWELSVRA